MKKALISGSILVLVVLAGFICIQYFSFIFAKSVVGEIVGLERVTQPTAVFGAASPDQIYSFAVAVKIYSGEIFTASSEDRQWAVAQKGQCVEAKYFPYPPWDLEKGGTYYGARLQRLFDCNSSLKK